MKKEEEIKQNNLQQLQEPPLIYQAKVSTTDPLDDDWTNAISGDEFVKRVHQHIDEKYAQK